MGNSIRDQGRTPINADFTKVLQPFAKRKTDLVEENRLALLKKIHVELKGCGSVCVHMNRFQIGQVLDKLGQRENRNIDGRRRFYMNSCDRRPSAVPLTIMGLRSTHLGLLFFSFFFHFVQLLEHPAKVGHSIFFAQGLIVFLVGAH